MRQHEQERGAEARWTGADDASCPTDCGVKYSAKSQAQRHMPDKPRGGATETCQRSSDRNRPQVRVGHAGATEPDGPYSQLE